MFQPNNRNGFIEIKPEFPFRRPELLCFNWKLFRWMEKRFGGFHSVGRNCCVSTERKVNQLRWYLARFHSVGRNCCVSTSHKNKGREGGSISFHSVGRNCCVSTVYVLLIAQDRAFLFPFRRPELLCFNDRRCRLSRCQSSSMFPFRRPELLCFNDNEDNWTPPPYQGFHSVGRNCGVSTGLMGGAPIPTGASFHSVGRNCGVSTGRLTSGRSLVQPFPFRRPELRCFNPHRWSWTPWLSWVSIPSAGIAVFQLNHSLVFSIVDCVFPFRRPELRCFNARVSAEGGPGHGVVSIPSAGIAVFQHWVYLSSGRFGAGLCFHSVGRNCGVSTLRPGGRMCQGLENRFPRTSPGNPSYEHP